MHPTGSLSPIVAGVAATAAARAARRDSAEAVGSFVATAARVTHQRAILRTSSGHRLREFTSARVSHANTLITLDNWRARRDSNSRPSDSKSVVRSFCQFPLVRKSK
jgi:hypothetical protein